MSTDRKKPTPPIAPSKPTGLPGLPQSENSVVAADRVEEALEEALTRPPPADPGKEAKKATRVLLHHRRETTTKETWSGPIPPPEYAAALEKLHPGALGRMFGMAEKEQGAIIAQRADVLARNDRFRILSLCGGVVALAIIVAAVIYLAMNDHDGVAATLAGLGIASVVGVFVNARLSVPASAQNSPPTQLNEPEDE